ncbi:PHD finger protein 14 [Orchesella cincta]|uniref:PHD finger protein 14 n=1 Tax=Orchesella cincta TaxID=48709 RepID=A0A1D2N0R1_ORCCI|nr:PHD finger protein 14 [Orchesella cincta]
MSRKASQPQTSPQAGGNVDFLVRTMIERESSGKRPIKPKNVEDLLQSTMQDESDDPDFDCKDEDSDSEGTGVSDDDDSSSGSGNEKGNENAEDSDESDDEDYVEKEENSASSSDNEDSDSDSSDSSNDESHESDDEPEIPKKSALRETLEKLNETNNFVMKRPNKRKRKKKVNDNAVKASSRSKKPKTDVGIGKTKSKQTKSKQASKISKNKKGVIVKKSKVARKKESEKKKKKVKKSDEKSKSRQRSIANLVDSMTANQKENRNEIAIDMKKPICSACLGDKSDDANEIVECDSCGISVHESCYGLSADNVSVSSGSGSSSCTEPWFCDVCKSGSENISCELCPVEGGLFKESTAGRWVHLVCAMYTQGVALHNDSTINLFEIPYSRWGSHNCAACEYERLAHAGIVIRCDAGLCKTYFHATCAQKLGLLSDPTQVDFAEADPYFVSCKLHTAREIVKRRIRIFNALQEQLRIKRERKETIGLPSAANGDHARIFRKLEKVRQKTAQKRAHYLASVENVDPQTCPPDQLVPSSLPSSWTGKKHRLMHTSARLGNDFLKKSECLGEDIVALELEVKHEKIFSNVRRKWNVLPAMSVEYSAYYSDRENRISNLIDQCDKAAKENKELIEQEEHLKEVVETFDINHDAMKEETASVSRQLESLVSLITFVCPTDKKITSKFQSLLKTAESASGRRKSPSTSRGDKKSPSSRRSSTTTKKAQKNRVLSPSPSRPGKLALPTCITCSKSTQQHLITRCDKCKGHYHLGCLDPPLTRMPKRSRLCGWMCSDCCDAPSEAEGHVDTEAPRTLRGRTKIRKPGKYRGSDESEEDTKMSPDLENKVVVAKKSPAKSSSSLDFSETEVVEPLYAATVPVTNTSPPVKRRRSGSATASVPVLLNAIEYSSASDNVLPTVLQQKSVKLPNLGTPGEGTTVVEPKAPKKRKSPQKLPKPQGQKLLEEDAAVLNSSTVKPAVIPSPKSKRKSAEVPLTMTNIKINGISETTLATTEVAETIAPISNKKKSKKSVVSSAVVDNLSKNGIAVLDTKTDQVKKKPKSRMKKEVVEGKIQQSVILASSNITSENNSLGVVKPKKPRKKANKVDLNFIEGNEITTQPPEKKARKRPAKPKLPVQSTNLVARDETTVGDRDEGKVTSQMQKIASKMTENQNGAVKIPSQKRKKSATAVSTVNTVTLISSPVISGQKGTPDEKEKCIPPKKRKRAPSNAQQQNPTIDSIIDAVVSSGQISNSSAENGHRDLNSNEGSTITMQGISPNRQLAPGQNIMEGKAMGSNPGGSSGETVTVDASFIIDGPTSNHSSFSGNGSNPMFYSSSNHITSTGSAQEDGAIMKLSGMGRESFQVGNSTNSSENVIRLQYMDSEAEGPSSSVPDSVAMPPPLNPSSMGVCATCIKNDNRGQLVMCDKCRLEFHFMCLIPPVKGTPRKKGCPWFCKNCDDEIESSQENGIARQPH